MAEHKDSLEHLTFSKDPTPKEIAEKLELLGPRWSIDGPDLKLELRGAPMAKYGTAAAHAAWIADEMNHHPTIVLEYGGLTLRIHTHDKKAITSLDIVFAARLEQWLRAAGW